MPKILIVEDEVSVADALCFQLERDRHTVELATDGKTAIELLSAYTYDVVILDLGLPDQDGISVLRQFRSAGGKTPVIVLTGQSEITKRVLGLDAGADDYVIKPIDVRELSARIRSNLRRPTENYTPNLRVGGLVVDPAAFSVMVNQRRVQLTNQEFALIEFLARHPNQYFTAEQLLDRVWRASLDVSPLTVRTCVKRIRQKVDTPGEESIIENHKGLGYRLPSS